MRETLDNARKPLAENASILLVGDAPADLHALRTVLEELGRELVEAQPGEDALARVRAEEFAVILLDVRAPGRNGFDAARLIRSERRAQRTPIIFLTAFEINREQAEEGYALGAVDFLVEPFLPAVLKAKLRNFVELFEDNQRAKRESEQLRLLVQGTIDYAIFMLDPQGRIISWNPGAQRLKGYAAHEIIGQHFSRFYPQEAIDRGWPDYELEVAQAVGRFEDEGWRVRKDGSQFWANVVITALRDETGSLRGFSKITRDLTERKQAEENARRLAAEAAARQAADDNARLIQAERERLHVTLASIGDAVISADAEGRVNFLNPVAEALVGWKHDEARGRSLADVFRIVNEYTRQPVENPAIKALRQGAIVGLANHTLLIARDGVERPIDDSAAPIRDAQGGVIGCVLVFRDISERRRAETQLQESEKKLRLLADTMPQIVFTATPDGQADYLNQRWYDYTGLPRGDVGAESWLSAMHPDDRDPCMAEAARTNREGVAFEMELRLREGRTGQYRWHLARSVPVRDDQGRIIGWYGTSTDIHDRKRAEDANRFLASASATLATIVDYESTLQKVAALAVPHFADWCAVDVVEADGSLRRLAVVHADPEKVKLAHELNQRYPPDPASPHGAFKVVRTGQSDRTEEITEEMILHGARDERHLQILRELGLKSHLCVPLKGRTRLLGVITFVSAESDRRYSQTDQEFAEELGRRAAIALENSLLYAELRETDRLKDEFLAMLAHELRNPLAPIRNSLHILKQPETDGPTDHQMLSIAERQVQHMARLLDDLLDVSRISRGSIELRKEPLDLTTVVNRSVEAARPLFEQRGHELTVSLPPASLRVKADATRLEQVLTNLLNNAAKYTDPGGHISVDLEGQSGEAILRVRDTGIGIAPEMLPRIFDPFVQAERRLDRAQGGVGIGLTLVNRLVALHGGRVAANSPGLGQGSEFTVRLPTTTEGGEAGANDPAGGEAQPLPRLRVLVVDDNPDAANTLALLLRFAGQDVQTAYDGPSAIARAQEFMPELVLLDIGMPGMDGYEVAARLRNETGLGSVLLVALTGWGQDEDRRRSAEAGFDQHMVKPVEPQRLREVLRNLAGKRQ
ncbi:MAG TPA: PAS domain S-box protein [Pirellulales bacterium]|nr:PAS domain S-box protein [Pirellulales bacterium]